MANENRTMEGAVDDSKRSETKHLGPCIVAALVWLALSIYMLYVIPKQLDIREQFLKPGQMQAELPGPLRVALYIHAGYGTALVALFGVAGCLTAYARRSLLMAHAMILIGALLLSALVWVVLVSMPKASSPMQERNAAGTLNPVRDVFGLLLHVDQIL